MKEVRIGNKTFKVKSQVDAVGLFCPMPVVKLKIEMEDMASNEVAELLADDPGVLEDLPSWCDETGNKLLSINKDREGIFVAYIEKRTKA